MSMIINPGGPNDRASIGLETKFRRRIPNEQPQARSPLSMKAAKDFHSNFEVRSLQSTYNCMGLVFAVRRTWIETDCFFMIVEDDGYRKRNSMKDTKPGDVAVYREAASGRVIHVGIIAECKPNVERANFDIRVISQFGKDGEYIHDSQELPSALQINNPSFEVWTEAVIHE